jgi:uncharacterized membrane protein YvbJ
MTRKENIMAFCKNCGAELPNDAKFCTSCGAPAQENETVKATPVVNETVYTETPAPKERSLNVGMLVWSIINTALCCCPVFGIIAIIMTILAKSADTDEDESRKLRTAKILNIVSTVIIVLFVVIYVIYVLLAVAGLISAFGASEISTGTL